MPAALSLQPEKSGHKQHGADIKSDPFQCQNVCREQANDRRHLCNTVSCRSCSLDVTHLDDELNQTQGQNYRDDREHQNQV